MKNNPFQEHLKNARKLNSSQADHESSDSTESRVLTIYDQEEDFYQSDYDEIESVITKTEFDVNLPEKNEIEGNQQQEEVTEKPYKPKVLNRTVSMIIILKTDEKYSLESEAIKYGMTTRKTAEAMVLGDLEQYKKSNESSAGSFPIIFSMKSNIPEEITKQDKKNTSKITIKLSLLKYTLLEEIGQKLKLNPRDTAARLIRQGIARYQKHFE